MNKNIQQVTGKLLVISQFTLAADTQRTSPCFSSAAAPEQAQKLYEHLIELCRMQNVEVARLFWADMQVHLVNDGPVTFL